VYPRFDTLFSELRDDIATLEKITVENKLGQIIPNQCELSYINFVPINDGASPFKNVSDILKPLRLDDEMASSDFSFQYRHVLRRPSNEPYARLSVFAATSQSPQGEIGISLNLIARGAPEHSSLQSSLTTFLAFREEIVRTFDRLTTASAHQFWGKVK
jgi:uncharacterized protein (TIGR04255 family)